MSDETISMGEYEAGLADPPEPETTMQIRIPGRTDTDDFFGHSGVLQGPKPHTPFLVFIAAADGAVEISIVDRASDLAVYPRETPVMAQWMGKFRSDYFKLTVGEVLDALDAAAKRENAAARAIGIRRT